MDRRDADDRIAMYPRRGRWGILLCSPRHFAAIRRWRHSVRGIRDMGDDPSCGQKGSAYEGCGRIYSHGCNSRCATCDHTEDLNMIDGVMIKDLARHPDERGFFEEIIRKTDKFFAEGFGQVSHSFMHTGVVKAWHIHKTQVDWWYVMRGVIQTVLFDLREGSPTHRQLMEIVLGRPEESNKVVKIPPGVAHGLKVLEGPADLVYVTSGVYTKDEEGRIIYNDPDIGYDWVAGMPITNKHIT